MRIKKRITTIFLTLALALSLLPSAALAATTSVLPTIDGGVELDPARVCAGDPDISDCPAPVHSPGCPLYVEPETTYYLCTGAIWPNPDCKAKSHQPGCPKYVEEPKEVVCIEASVQGQCNSPNHKPGCIEACTESEVNCPGTQYHKPHCIENCTGKTNCDTFNHKANCLSLCTKNDNCPNTEGLASAHQTGCPKGAATEGPAPLWLYGAVAGAKAEGRNLSVSWTILTDPDVVIPCTTDFISEIWIVYRIGDRGGYSEIKLGSKDISNSYTIKNFLPTVEQAGKNPITVYINQIVFWPRVGNTVQLGGKTYTIEGNSGDCFDSPGFTLSYTPTISDPGSYAVENPGKPANVSYEPTTGKLSWSISPTYENNVTPSEGATIDRFRNEHWILTLKQGSTVIEKDIHFDTEDDSSYQIFALRNGNTFSADYKPSKTLSPGTYTIELLNERSMSDGSNFTGTGTFTVGNSAKASSAKAALEKLLSDGFTSSSTAKDAQAAVLDTVSGTTAAAKLQNLAGSLQDNSSTGRDLTGLVQDVEKKLLDAQKITVSPKSDSKLDTSIASVTGLGLNTASGSQITIEAAPASKSYDAPSGARSVVPFSLNVSGLSDNKNMAFPVQVAMKLPSGFNSTDKVYVLHYTGSSSPEKLDAYIHGGNVIFTTTSFSDFALVQESANGRTITVSPAVGGTVSTDRKEAAKGSTVTATIKPDAGYSLSTVTVTGKDSKTVTVSKQSDTQYTFIMPDTDVTVQAVFSVSQSSSFSDVPIKHTFYKEISWTAQNGLMNGVGNGLFNPSGEVTRQQLWMVLGRMAGANPANMAAARTWSINNEISDGTNPTGAVSRQQLVTMLYRYAVKQGLSTDGATDINTYSDNSAVSSYARDALAWAVGNGIVSGTSDGRLNPQGSATRAHFAAFLYRFDQKASI